MKFLRFFIIVFLLMCNVSIFADKLEHLRTSKKIITVDVISAPYYAIQIAALRLPPKNADFFNSVDVVREFLCNDGYVRYTVGEYSTFGAAARNLEQYRSMGYTDVFVLNLRKVQLTNSPVSGSSASGRKGSGVSSSVFVPVPGQKYTIQLGAMRFPVYVSEFEGFDNVKEYYMKSDKIYRYCTGLYEGDEALRELEKVKTAGYRDAYLVPIEHYAPYQIE